MNMDTTTRRRIDRREFIAYEDLCEQSQAIYDRLDPEFDTLEKIEAALLALPENDFDASAARLVDGGIRYYEYRHNAEDDDRQN